MEGGNPFAGQLGHRKDKTGLTVKIELSTSNPLFLVDMSDAESETSATSAVTDFTAATDDTNFYELQYQLQEMTDALESACLDMTDIDRRVKRCEKPVTDTAIERFNDPAFLAASPFRHETFAMKPPGLPNIDLGKRYAYKDIVATIRNYVFNEKLVNPDGTIRVNTPLATLFEIKDKETTFLTLLRQLRRVLI